MTKYSHISLRVPKKLKDDAFEEIKSLGMTPTEVFRDVLEFIVKEGRVPVRKEIISDEDATLLDIVKKRLANPGESIPVTIEELRSGKIDLNREK